MVSRYKAGHTFFDPGVLFGKFSFSVSVGQWKPFYLWQNFLTMKDIDFTFGIVTQPSNPFRIDLISKTFMLLTSILEMPICYVRGHLCYRNIFFLFWKWQCRYIFIPNGHLWTPNWDQNWRMAFGSRVPNDQSLLQEIPCDYAFCTFSSEYCVSEKNAIIGQF